MNPTTLPADRMGQRIPMKTKRDFAELLKAYRDKKGITQAEAAAELGVNLRTFQNWECSRSTPRGFALTAITKLVTD